MESSPGHLPPVYKRFTDLVAERGEGCLLFARPASGGPLREYLDMTTGIGVTNTGHCHPAVVASVRDQAGKLLHGQSNIVLHPPVLELVQALGSVVPSVLGSFFFKNSGAEVIEAAVKLARMATGRPNTVVFQGSFHGRTVGAMSLTTSKTIYRAGYQPLMPGVCVAPFPYAYRYGWDPDRTVAWCLDELRFLLSSQTAPSETAAMLVEPVLGEGGYVVPPQGFLQGVRQICDEHGILLIVDEIQSGFGRTGRWFAFEHAGIVPDIVVMAKGLASGLPLAAIATREETMSAWAPGAEGGTYCANPVACAAAVATIQAMRDEGMVENAQVRGEELMAGLRALQSQYPQIGDVRGLGLMVGVEFADGEGKPDPTTAKKVQKACLEEAMLVLTCGTFDQAIRFVPPLVITAGQVRDALARFERALGSI